VKAKKLKYYFPNLNLNKSRNAFFFASLKSGFLFCKKMKMSKHIKRCPNCERMFGSNKKQTYCSHRCESEYKSKLVNCKICGVLFVNNSVKDLCCSEKCKVEHNKKMVKRQRNKHRNPKLCQHNRICKLCSKPFVTFHSNRTTCSEDCRAKVNFKNIKLFNVFERDNFRCAYCGKTSYEDNVKLIVEHIYPRSKGGTNDSFNVITACSDCNNRKKDKIMDFNVILTLWQIVEKRNKEKNIDWDFLKCEFDRGYKTNQ
jgi:hypothetical protein